MKEKYNFLFRAVRRVGALVLTLTAAVSLGHGEALAEEGAGSEEPSIVLGRKLNFVAPKQIQRPPKEQEDHYILWRILFPIKAEGRWDGFFGYVDFTNYPTKENNEIKGGADDRDIWGPVFLKDDCVSPFSKADFIAALKKMENEAPIIVLDRLKWKGKVSEATSENGKNDDGTEGGDRDQAPNDLNGKNDDGEEGGDRPGPRSDLDPVTLAVVNKFEGKYAALFPDDLRAGWVWRGASERFEIELAVAADVPVKPEAVNRPDSVVLIGKEYYALEELQLRAWRVLEAMPEGQGGSVFLAEEGFYAAPPFNYYYVLTPFGADADDSAETAADGTASSWPGAGGFFKEDVVGKELILCLKVAPEDPIYAPGYVVARAKLFEGEVVSALNSDFDSRIYFKTNLTDEYLGRIFKYERRDGPVKIKLIEGQDDDDPDRAEDDPKDKEVRVETYGLTGGEEKTAQAFATLRRQIKKDERIKLSLVCNPDGELVEGKRENNGETKVYFNTRLTDEELEKRLNEKGAPVKVTLFGEKQPKVTGDGKFMREDEWGSEGRITLDEDYTLEAGEELKMEANEYPNAKFVLWIKPGARGKITEVYVTTDMSKDDFEKMLDNDGYKLTKMKSGKTEEVGREVKGKNLVREGDKAPQAYVKFKLEQSNPEQELRSEEVERIGIEILPGEDGDRSLKIGNTIRKVGPSDVRVAVQSWEGEVFTADESGSEGRIIFDKPFELRAGEELVMEANGYPKATFALSTKPGATGKITEAYISTKIEEEDFRKVLRDTKYTIGKVDPSKIEFVARKYGIGFEDTVEEVKGSAFKDERTFSAQALFKGEVNARNARLKVDYQDYFPLLRRTFRGRLRWKVNADFVNSEVEEEEYVDAAANLLLACELGKTSRSAWDIGGGGDVKFSYIPSAPKAEEFTGLGLGGMAEASYSHGNLKEQKNVGRLRVSAEIFNVWEVKVAPATPGDVPVAGPWSRFWQCRVPVSYSYSFNGFRLAPEVALSFLRKEDRIKFRIREQVPLYYALTASLDPKFVGGFQLDSQSALAFNFVYEHGLRPPRLGERGNKFSVGVEYAPVTK
ncbi:MAG: hypothetical protein V3W11_09320 [bacterium]